ncbi:hypothetical protein BDN72DRAFT_544490 [Pluteus cervinus]|uniref:Uncharacterized protein n=1 Tax=Pluteus cervinus TaxID=181527 RepID=A0ACD3AYG6_9AGAR|nr:hypothetical protein BDN72DRAFT_544490 [Pluteus cervinus]
MTPEPEREMTPISDNESEYSGDEYCPATPPPPPRRRSKPCKPRKIRNKPVKTRKTRRSVKKEPSESPLPPTRRRRSGRTPALRNKLAANPDELNAIISSNDAAKYNYTCPECDWRQHKQRAADFYRHLNTHIPRKPLWCSGVPLPEGEECGRNGEQPYEFEGSLKVGGCMTPFSRMDALRRHLHNSPDCLAEERLR